MEIAICVVGPVGLTWPRWKGIVKKVEELGFSGLFCSDHFTGPVPPDFDSLEPLTALTWAAGATSRIELGTLVSPFSFRDPVFLARVAKDIDALSGGRFILGMGAGWNKREHVMFGYPTDETPKERSDRFEEGVRLVHGLLRDELPVTLQGKYYSVQEAVLLPRPPSPGSPRLLIGGNGEKRTLPLAARYADEWNCDSGAPALFRARNERLDDLLDANGRGRNAVKRTASTSLINGKQAEDIFGLMIPGFSVDMGISLGYIVGPPEVMMQQIDAYATAGAERLVVQLFDLASVDCIEQFAEIVAPMLN